MEQNTPIGNNEQKNKGGSMKNLTHQQRIIKMASKGTMTSIKALASQLNTHERRVKDMVNYLMYAGDIKVDKISDTRIYLH